MSERLPVLQRIDSAKVAYLCATGKLPTRLVLTPDDVMELAIWLFTHEKEPAYVGPPHSSEPLIYGMRYTVEYFTKELRVYFHES